MTETEPETPIDPQQPANGQEPAVDLDALQAQVADLKDKNLRLLAELENTRVRMQRELSEGLRYATMPLIRDLLPVYDNLLRAIQSAGDATDGIVDGVKMVAQQFEQALERHGCKKIPALGEMFDPNLHEALLHQPSAEHPAMTVILEYAPGFVLHDRVVRPSKVIVSSGPPVA